MENRERAKKESLLREEENKKHAVEEAKRQQELQKNINKGKFTYNSSG